MANESTAAEIAKLAEHAASGEYHNAFRYREADRPSSSIEDVSSAQLGHMLDTLNDALIIMGRLVDKPNIDVSLDPAYEPTTSVNPALPYLKKIASDPRNASSYARTDIERLQEGKKEPDLADLSNRVHGLLRLQAHLIGQTFIMPDEVKPLAVEYEAVIKRYTNLLDAHLNKDGKRDYTRIPEEEMEAFAPAYDKAAERLFSALKALKTADVKIDGKTYHIPNDTPVNDRRKNSFPALVLFGASIFSKGVADRNKRPGKLEFEGKFRTILGAESLLTDTAQFLADRAKNGDPSCSLPDFNRKSVKEMLPTYKRSLQLVLAFCRTANCGYDKLYDDLEMFIKMSGDEPKLRGLQNPQEAALMLHAVDRRFAREGIEPALQEKLRDYANQLDSCNSSEQMLEKFGRDMVFQRTLQRSKEVAEHPQQHGMTPDVKMTTVVDTLTQLQAFIPPSRGTGSYIAGSENRQEGQGF